MGRPTNPRRIPDTFAPMARRGQSGFDGVTPRSGWLVCLLLFTGCSDTDTGPAHLDEYLLRLSTVTGVQLAPGAPHDANRFDLPREPATELPASNQIDLIEDKITSDKK